MMEGSSTDTSEFAEYRTATQSGSAKLGANRRVRVVLLIRSLTTGGAERQLVALAKGLDRKIFEVTVVSFYAGGEFAQELAAANVPVISLNKTGRWDILLFTLRLVTLLRKLRPDILRASMAGANLAALLVKSLFRGTRVVWNIEASYIDYTHYDWPYGPLIGCRYYYRAFLK
jgi:hypothetical protein